MRATSLQTRVRKETSVSFTDCVMLCARDKDFVAEYCRLSGLKDPTRLTPLEQAIDRAAGYNAADDFCRRFVETVYEIIWLPMLGRP